MYILCYLHFLVKYRWSYHACVCRYARCVFKKGSWIKLPCWKDNLHSSVSGRRESFRVTGRIRINDIKSRKSHILCDLYSFTQQISNWGACISSISTKYTSRGHKETNMQTNKQNKTKILLLLLFRVHSLSSVPPGSPLPQWGHVIRAGINCFVWFSVQIINRRKSNWWALAEAGH